MEILKKKRKKKIVSPAKERTIRQLIAILESAGIRVRREALKQGYGWKALSGGCALLKEDIFFIDSKTGADEQINYLVMCINYLNISPSEEEMSSLPQSVRSSLLG